MRKRKKITKLWIVLTLVVSLFAVQTLQIMAEASTETADFSNPTIVVNDITELQNAVANANDGDVIGINSLGTVHN